MPRPRRSTGPDLPADEDRRHAEREAFLDETIAFWQPYSRRALTREDAREMIENVTGYFALFDEWARAERRKRPDAASTQEGGKRGN